MATKKRPRAAKAALTRQRAQQRRRSRSKRYIGETAAQSVRAREAQRERVREMVEADEAQRRAARVEVPLSATIATLLEDTLRLVGTLVLAPFRLAAALRRAAASSPG